ncbi:hypothetical protein [Evansella cellulosilytica]|uniref:Lipocalin-like domain-containing protein n=1 Tax=Evansella cellulosilytica (strain ATCC 21833 / DSM 2522 / FERM P-1141 / JCM 9156 / N-4) TaxID=649639 RepID=E6TVX1_EVAC2|nr:hypothetical protein [Evansella cellulosilytica]ADU28680.1 hypothetical protein Bcell_0398 [Evansella cellulosilytica DSM 2522]
MKKVSLVALLFLFIVSMMVGCSEAKSQQAIIGKWAITDFNEKETDADLGMLGNLQNSIFRMAFAPGTVIEFINEERMSIGVNSIDYKWVSDSKLEMGPSTDEAILFDVTLDDTNLILENQFFTIDLNRTE